jgi:hypothetical protein
MKYIYLILFCGLMNAQELQVEGDLTVSGDIHSAVIDSLQAEIENLQNLLSDYSGAIRTRIIELEVSLNLNENNDMVMVVPINELVGISNNWYNIIPIDLAYDPNVCGGAVTIHSGQDTSPYNQLNEVSLGYYRHDFSDPLNMLAVLPIIIHSPSPTLFLFGDLSASNCSGTITLLVTSEN